MVELLIVFFLGMMIGAGCAQSWRFFRRVREAVEEDRAVRFATMEHYGRHGHPR